MTSPEKALFDELTKDLDQPAQPVTVDLGADPLAFLLPKDENGQPLKECAEGEK